MPLKSKTSNSGPVGGRLRHAKQRNAEVISNTPEKPSMVPRRSISITGGVFKKRRISALVEPKPLCELRTISLLLGSPHSANTHCFSKLPSGPPLKTRVPGSARASVLPDGNKRYAGQRLYHSYAQDNPVIETTSMQRVSNRARTHASPNARRVVDRPPGSSKRNQNAPSRYL